MAGTSPEETARKMIENLPAKTGKSLEQWLGLLREAGLEKHGEIVNLLKSGHGVTHGFANLIAHRYRTGDRPAAEEDLVAAQYAGPKQDLQPIYEAIVQIVSGFGEDIEISPKKTYVSLRRNRQFALVQPSTRDRIDVGINLKGEPASGRLEASGSLNAMVSHRVRVTSKKEVDAELKRWLRQAYDRA